MPKSRGEVAKEVKELIVGQMSMTKTDGASMNIEIQENQSVSDDLGLDSVEIMDLIAAIETHFGISLEASEFIAINKVGEIIDGIYKIISEG